MAIHLGRILIYSKKIPQMIDFYSRHFGYTAVYQEDDRIVELRPKGIGIALLLHPASKGQKEGQVLVKLVFDTEDVVGFCKTAKENGLDFGPIHQADGYVFANTKDPSKNSVSVSNRAFAQSHL